MIATAPIDGVLDDISAAMSDPAFSLANPNRARALIGAFAASNPTAFHKADGSGYRFHAEQTLAIDRLNPQTAARMLAPLGRWKRMDPERQALMRAALQSILDAEGISRDVYEIAEKGLRG